MNMTVHHTEKPVDPQIHEYIEKQKSPQKEILWKIREIFLRTIPDCEEKTAWGAVTFAEKKFYAASLKNRVHVGFSINGLNKEEIKLFEGSGKTMRHIKINSLHDIDEQKLAKLIKMVAEKAVCSSC